MGRLLGSWPRNLRQIYSHFNLCSRCSSIRLSISLILVEINGYWIRMRWVLNFLSEDFRSRAFIRVKVCWICVIRKGQTFESSVKSVSESVKMSDCLCIFPDSHSNLICVLEIFLHQSRQNCWTRTRLQKWEKRPFQWIVFQHV